MPTIRRSTFQHSEFPTSAILAVAMLCGGLAIAGDLKPKEIAVIDTHIVDRAPRHVVTSVLPQMRVIAPEGATSAAAFAFIGAEEPMLVGVASYDKVELELRDWPFDEVMVFLEGELEITSKSGKVTVVKAGDTIVMPKGFNGHWRQLQPIKKLSIIYDANGFYKKKLGTSEHLKQP